MKKIQDLKKDGQNKTINLKSTAKKQSPDYVSGQLKKQKNYLYKQKSPIKNVKDLEGTKPKHYLYIRGKKYTPPRFLGNLLRIAFFGFLIILSINTVNVYYLGKQLQKNISTEAYQGYALLLDAGKNATKIEFSNASATFEQALKNFSEAEDKLWFISTDRSSYADSNNLTHSVNALLVGGKHFAVAGSFFLEAVEEFNKIPLYFVSKNQNANSSVPSLTETLKSGLAKTDLAIAEINQAADQISTIQENSLPSEVKVRVTFAKNQVAQISNILKSTQEHFPAMLNLLGDTTPHRYLILLQNNNEIRPSGGFIGSYILMNVNKGYIEKIETQDVYGIDGSYKGFIQPTDDLKNIFPNWRFRDSNYSSDFPTSAAKAKWFLEKEGGPTVDTVIGINQGLLKDLLEITGPIQVGNFGKLDSENYNLLLSYIIEGKIWGPQDPKHILKLFIPAFKEAIFKEENVSKVASKLYKAVQQKHIMLYSGDSDVEALFDALNVSGRVYQTKENEDYLSVINTSIGGTKSDQFVDESILHDTNIDKSGNLTDEVAIKRHHGWDDTIYFQWKKTLQQYHFNEMPDGLIDILGRGLNKVYTKVYVPAGSILISSNGSDVLTGYDPDLKKTYFSTIIAIKAGDTQTIKIKYRLPFTLDLSQNAGIYKLFVDKQPGSRGSIFNKTIHTDPNIRNLAVYPQETRLDSEHNLIYATNLVYDRYFSGIWARD